MHEAEHPAGWQLDVAGLRSPWWNMAVDRWLLRRCEAGEGGAVLRLYGWDRPTLSLGRHQEVAADRIDLEACRHLGVAVVRRPTGGRAVHHGRGLTYAVVAPIPPGAGSVTAIYRWVVAAILEGLGELGLSVVELGRHRGGGGGDLKAACYAAPSSGEVALGGGKWIGSAQRRLRRAFLQHGAIPLADDSRRLAACIEFEDEARRQAWVGALSARTAPVAERLACITPEDLVTAIRRGFERHHGVPTWQPMGTPSEELLRAVETFRADPRWTLVAP